MSAGIGQSPPDQPSTRTKKEKAGDKVSESIVDALDEGLSPDEIQSRIAAGIEKYYEDRQRLASDKIIGTY